jgi:hypothetical protein
MNLAEDKLRFVKLCVESEFRGFTQEDRNLLPKAVTNYFCTGLPAVFNMRSAGLYVKNCSNIFVAKSMVLLEKELAIIQAR